MVDERKHLRMAALVLTAMLLASSVPAWSHEAGASDIVLHISALSDGKKERTVSFPQPGTDRSLAVNIPNGARIVGASMNVSNLPLTEGGYDYPENVSVDVGNDGTPEWVFQGKAYGQMGRQTMFASGAQYVNVGLPANGGTNSSTTVRLPRNATVTSANMNLTGGGNFLVIYADNDPTYVNDVLAKLRAFTNDLGKVDAFNAGAGTPTLDMLKGYSGCLVYSNSYTSITGYTSFQDRLALGNVLADYVDYGGGVVTAHFCWYSSTCIGGRFNDGGYFLVPTGGTTGWTTANMAIQSILMPNHPIMNGVTDIHFVQNTLISSPAVTAGVNGGQIVFTWTLGNCAGALVKTMPNGANRVDLYFIPWSDSVPYRSSYGGGYSGNGDVLMKNSLVWTGGAGSGNFSLDVGNDGHIDWANPNMSKPEISPDLSSQLNSYLAAAQPTGTDSFGNEYVDVPIAAASNASGKLTLSNLSIIYKLTSNVGVNPVTGDLAGALDALVPRTYDRRSTNVTVAIFSNHTGKIKISDIDIDFTLVHPPIIQTRTPEETTVYMNENTMQEFAITAWDPYDFPMCATWSVNKKVYLQNEWNMSWFADFDANGSYSVTASVDNGEQKTTTSWVLIVKNVNRKPVIDSFEPEKSFGMDENSSAIFTVAASDPDGDTLTYAWYADGKRVSGEEPSCEYKTNYASAGKHEVKVSVLDAAASTVQSWEVTVNNVNAAPEIADSTPAGDEVSMNENSTKRFTVADLSIDGDKQVVSWLIDGNSTGATGRSYEYAAGFDSAGRHEVAADVSDGKLSARRTWYVNVADVNRPPVAAIGSPAAGAEFMVGDEITLDGTQSSDPDNDPLSMTWTDGQKTLGTGATLTVKLSKGKHTIALKVDDGRKDGTASGQVQMIVRYVDFTGKLTVDTETPVEGKQIRLSALLTNRGDGGIAELPVSFKVDGTEVASTTIESIEPDADFPLEFSWKAVKGDHTLEVTVNGQNFSKAVTVAKRPSSAPAGGDMMIPMVFAVAAVVAIVAAVAVLGARRKRAPAAAAPPSSRSSPGRPGLGPGDESNGADFGRRHPPQRVEESPHAPAMTEEANAREAIENLESIIRDAESAGIDTAKARQSLKIARNFLKMGNYHKALLYCRTAEDSIG